jgi:hypothetical protein
MLNHNHLAQANKWFLPTSNKGIGKVMAVFKQLSITASEYRKGKTYSSTILDLGTRRL